MEPEVDSNSSPKRPKRQMKTPFQLETLEKTYAMAAYPSEATRAALAEKLGLSDRQLQMWFCHRRLKDKREAAAMKPCTPVSVGRRESMESPGDQLMFAEPDSVQGSRSQSESGGSDSGSSEFDNVDDMPTVPIKYYESPRSIMERRVIACVEAQLGEPLQKDGPILGVEFDDLPPGAFGAPIVPTEHQDRYWHSYDGNLCDDVKQNKDVTSSLYQPHEPSIRSDAYGHVVAKSYIYNSQVDNPSGRNLQRECAVEGQVSSASLSSQAGRQRQPSSPPRNGEFIPRDEDTSQTGRKRKIDEASSGRDVQIHEKKTKKELEKPDLLRRKREEQMKKEQEKQDRERRKEEQKMMREQQRQEERYQREERREMERREKFMQKALLQAERRKQKEERQREKEAARQKAAMERAMTRRIAKESMELIEDERLELMELAASSNGLPSILSLDYDTLQNLESFRDSLSKFPLKSVRLEKPFAVAPWGDSEENVGNLLMVWRFCFTFANVLGLWPFTLDEFVQAFHDHDSRLLSEIHISLLKLIIKDVEDVARTPSGGPGTNQYTAVNLEGGHPQIVEGAHLWGFNIGNWKKHLNPLTWPEILRQFALSAGFGPHLMKNSLKRVSVRDSAENKGCEDVVSTLRNGSAAETAVAVMQEKGSLQRKTRHRLTPGTVKFAAYHVLALEGSKGLNVIEIADKIQKSGLRDLTTSKTPEASISVALSRDPILFERVAPSTYCVRPAFRKNSADAEAILAEAREKIQTFTNSFLAGQNGDDGERDDDSDSDAVDASEVVDLAIPSDGKKTGESSNGLNYQSTDVVIKGTEAVYRDQEGVEIDESVSAEDWVEGLTEGEYSDISVEERLSALVALIGIANEGNTIRVTLEDRLDAANALKKQMLAEAQLDKRRLREETITAEDGHNSIDNTALQNGCMTERSRLQLKSYIGHSAEEVYAYRSLPLGQDRKYNRYWQFVASSSSQDPGSGRIFVESPDGNWMLIDSEEAFDTLLTSLDMRGTRESHLHKMLQKCEVSFKARVQITTAKKELSHSFKIDLGKSETDNKNALKRYEDLQIWLWRVCFNSSILQGLSYGKTRCLPLLGVCDICFDTYQLKEDLCPSCHLKLGEEEKVNLRIRLIKALLNSFEVSVPSEALQSSWTGNSRNTWGLKLLNSSSANDLLQILTQVEGAIKRDHLSADFETTEELLSYCASSRGPYYEYTRLGSFPQLPWVPRTSAAVALKLLELDASIEYVKHQKAETPDVEKAETIPVKKLKLKYAFTKDISKAETSEFDRCEPTKEDTCDHLCHTTSSSGKRKKVLRRGSSQPNKKSRKKIVGSVLESGRQSMRQGETLTQGLKKQGDRIHGQMQTRGPRTLRRRRTEKRVFTGALPDYWRVKNVVEGENDGSGNSTEAGEFDDNRVVEMSDEEDGENMDEDIVTKAYDCETNGNGDNNEGSNSLSSEEYSD